MINLEMIKKENHTYSCDNCNRVMPIMLHYTFDEYNELFLCEDCSNAMANLHYKVMENGESHVYYLDEIKRLTD